MKMIRIFIRSLDFSGKLTGELLMSRYRGISWPDLRYFRRLALPVKLIGVGVVDNLTSSAKLVGVGVVDNLTSSVKPIGEMIDSLPWPSCVTRPEE